MNCNSCDAIHINGLLCHEHGCPDSYKDAMVSCAWCGTMFKPEKDGDDLCSTDCAEACFS